MSMPSDRQRAWIVGKCSFRKASPRWVASSQHVVEAVLLHLEVDRAGDDVARRQFHALVVRSHEARSVRQLEVPALAAQRLGDQEAALLRVVQAGRVELDELHVADAAAGAPGHRDAVAGGGVGVAGVAIDLADATGGQHHARAGSVSTRWLSMSSA
jgi:hypothetical protein